MIVFKIKLNNNEYFIAPAVIGGHKFPLSFHGSPHAGTAYPTQTVANHFALKYRLKNYEVIPFSYRTNEPIKIN